MDFGIRQDGELRSVHGHSRVLDVFPDALPVFSLNRYQFFRLPVHPFAQRDQSWIELVPWGGIQSSPVTP